MRTGSVHCERWGNSTGGVHRVHRGRSAQPVCSVACTQSGAHRERSAQVVCTVYTVQRSSAQVVGKVGTGQQQQQRHPAPIPTTPPSSLLLALPHFMSHCCYQLVPLALAVK